MTGSTISGAISASGSRTNAANAEPGAEPSIGFLDNLVPKEDQIEVERPGSAGKRPLAPAIGFDRQ